MLTSFTRRCTAVLCTCALSPHPINEVGGIELGLRGSISSRSGAPVPISTVWNALDFDATRTQRHTVNDKTDC
ncbi:hypothetical protein F5888DRAFT_1738419 [Russula emetica]|nr:hypothetical protein F5888DRAFT_1752234 [Russula emetica]KAF8491083.1 hypothetical protein F5888DRAFT_1738419 [Russula emetica]